MMDAEALVYVDIQGQPVLAGRLWSRMRKGRNSASFEYDDDWLRRTDRFALEPALQLGPGPFHTPADKPMFGAIGDSAPDRWGRVLMRRAERRRADRAGETPRTLREIDYLLMVNDEARQGALRFALQPDGPFLAPSETTSIPPLVELPRLLSAADHVADDSDSDEDLRLLLAPGSSLGGARPKASVRDKDGQLAIVKFPHRDDDFDAVRWEAVALSLAEKAGITVPQWRLEQVGNKPVLLLRRFDRQDGQRIPFLSAMSMLEANDNETRSYLEFVDALRQYGAAPHADMAMLWRRIVFSVMISNTDDHLRNHGFLYEGADGWRLAPAYDMNPTPVDIKPRVLSTAIDLDDTTASLDRAFDVASYFDLDHSQARDIARQVGNAVSTWRQEAIRLTVPTRQIDRMASAFEHDGLHAALVL
ncbi:type II toxin-antitoxin system HipA family toxin [Phycisphaerales bacterium AB-hyl4]|uniref:Type II toxin-antitoxin system HipA family toxin n=1 Tax=Natronomicrosphaera hydrolytica TaxID=3242702 RepID=A0ABV4U5Q4_9BACT